MQASVFIATSLDGFIARTDGTLDWVPAGGGEPHGYDEFMTTVDALVIGRKPFETVLAFAVDRHDPDGLRRLTQAEYAILQRLDRDLAQKLFNAAPPNMRN